MKWKPTATSRKPDTAPLLLRNPLAVTLMLMGTVLGVLLAPRITVEESFRVATPEKMTSERLRSFLEEHSWLDYTTHSGETLTEIARTLRLPDPNRLRADNPQLVEIGNDQPLDPGMVLRVRYNLPESERRVEQEGD